MVLSRAEGGWGGGWGGGGLSRTLKRNKLISPQIDNDHRKMREIWGGGQIIMMKITGNDYIHIANMCSDCPIYITSLCTC